MSDAERVLALAEAHDLDRPASACNRRCRAGLHDETGGHDDAVRKAASLAPGLARKVERLTAERIVGRAHEERANQRLEVVTAQRDLSRAEVERLRGDVRLLEGLQDAAMADVQRLERRLADVADMLEAIGPTARSHDVTAIQDAAIRHARAALAREEGT